MCNRAPGGGSHLVIIGLIQQEWLPLFKQKDKSAVTAAVASCHLSLPLHTVFWIILHPKWLHYPTVEYFIKYCKSPTLNLTSLLQPLFQHKLDRKFTKSTSSFTGSSERSDCHKWNRKGIFLQTVDWYHKVCCWQRFMIGLATLWCKVMVVFPVDL